MTTQENLQAQVARSTSKPLIESQTYDWFFLVPAVWFLTGTFLDSWAHIHLARLETFFTPWHAILYSGFLVVSLGLVSVVLLNRARGATWRKAIPEGYELSVFGMIFFAISGVGDMFWHIFFGIEQNLDALFSPTHLGIIIAGCFFLTGPYRSLYRRSGKATITQLFMLLFAQLLLLAFLTIVTQAANPLAFLWPFTTSTGDDQGQLLAVLSMIFQTVLFTGLTLYTIRRWRLFTGFFTLLLTLNTVALSAVSDQYIAILVAVLAGLIMDGAYLWLRPSIARPFEFRLFIAVAAASLYAVYLVVLHFAGTILWTIHLSVGTPLIVGVVAWLLTYLVIPGQGPETREA